MRRWILPLAAISEIPNFDNSSIPSQDHYQISADTNEFLWPWRSYRTSPHNPPHLNIKRYDGKLSDGYVFLTPSDQKKNKGTYELSGTGFIMTQEGDMVFAGEEVGYSFCDEWVAGMTDFRPQQYNGRPHIVYWNGCNTQGAHWGHRWGRVTFIDEEYSNFTINPDLNINTLDPVNKGQIDVHEHQMTDDNTMVATSYNNTQVDLTSIGGGPADWVADSMFFEFDVKTGEVLFEWRALDHTSLQASHWGLSGRSGTEKVPWDWFHINSVQKVGKDYVISSRHHWAVYMISGKDGSVIWKLDGSNGGSFGSIPTEFKWQHHVRAQNVTEHGMTISLFNNHVNGPKNKNTQSQGLAFWLSLPHDWNHPPQLVHQLQTPNDLVFAATQGSYQMDVGNGNGFVGYGKVPLMREYGPKEHLLWQAWFGYDNSVMSYRAFKAEWHGTPKNWDPVAIFEPVRLQRDKPGRVYVSWNGATDIEKWAVFAGDDRENLQSVGVAEKHGFETRFELPNAQCVQLGAIRDGKIIRASNIACQDDNDDGMAPSPINDGENKEVPGKISDADDLSDLQSQREALIAEITDLRKELADLESGAWGRYGLFAAAASAVIVIVATSWAFMSWRSKKHRRTYTGLPNMDQDYRDDGSSGQGEALGLGVFHPPHSKRKVSPMIPQDAPQFEAAATTGRRRTNTMDDKFHLVEDEEEEEEEMATANARTPFLREHTGG